jgi:hypothetical protein
MMTEALNSCQAQIVYNNGVMSIESAIEQIIREGMERGEFDHLKGKGKPLDLTDYFNTPEDVRMGFSILKSNDFVPEEVVIMKELATLKEEIGAAPNEAERASLSSKYSGLKLKLSLLLDERRRRSR